ncbi:unnamed protein product [Clonostachys byssicola]|uniref:Uncharacterized protein n=1 Tax=Clonostachys byssicola TaxID=160290 RepID=A0A9N9UQN2_9HYPO|nr:unnamed protein product [Clonostachys byssicola]
MVGYPPVSPENGANFTSSLQTDTYAFIDSRTKSDHSGRSVFISGGNRGIGKAIAISFAQAGASFIALGCPDNFGGTKDEIEAAARQAGHGLPTVHCLHLDVTDSASVAEAAASVQSLTPGLDVLVNNAGFMTPALPVTEADEGLWWKTFEVNLKGVFLMSKHFIPLLMAKENGLKTLVNINSVAAHNIRPNASAYGVSKLAVLKFTEFLLVEHAEHGLISFSVHPGAIMTDLAQAMPAETYASLKDKPELTGDTIAFLTQERREWLSGRYISCTWDMEEFLNQEAQIVKDDKLKVQMTNPKSFDLSGDVAIVTGAGSRFDGEIGNGRAAAILLARHGAKVALVDFNPAWAQDTKRMIDSEGGVSEVMQADVTDEDACKGVVARTVELWGAVHILVNIVGVGGALGDATDVDLEAWNRDFRINVTSMVLMARHAIPEMRKVGRGSIVNMSSVSGLQGGNPSLIYPTTKGAIIQMTRAMAAHHGRENIRINCVAPGMVFTPMTRSRGMTEEIRQARIEQNLLKQEGTGWDVGYAILFLVSREAKWITGLIMPIDGGATAGRSDRPALKSDELAAENAKKIIQ